MHMNGQQRPIAMLAVVALVVEGITLRTMALRAITLAFASTLARPLAAATVRSAHFYMWHCKLFLRVGSDSIDEKNKRLYGLGWFYFRSQALNPRDIQDEIRYEIGLDGGER